MSLKIAVAISPHFLNKENRAPLRWNKHKQAESNEYAHAAFSTVVSMPLEVLVKHITSGKAISVSAVKENWRKEDNFISSQLMGADFDHGHASVDALLEDAFVRDHAFLVYPTASSTDAAPRSRVLFALDTPITDKDEYKRLVKRLLHRFDLQPDEQCKDAARVFYGSDKPGYRADVNKCLPVAVLTALPPHPDELKPPPAERQATAIADLETKMRAEKYSLAAKQNIFTEALSVPSGGGLRHGAFNGAVCKAIAKAKGGWPGFESIEGDLRYLGLQMGRNEDEIARSIKGAWDEVSAEPLSLEPRPTSTSPIFPSGLSSSGVIIPSANGSAPVTNGGTIPNGNGKQAPAVLTWKTSDEAGEHYLKSLEHGRGDNKLPLIFPFKSLRKFGGLARVMPRGILVGVVGMSGGTKTSFTESVTEPFRQMGLHGIWWGIEWTWDQMFARAVQRHGGATVTEKQLHDMWLDEDRLKIPTNRRFGERLTVVQEEESKKVANRIMGWKGKSHQITEAATDVDAVLLASAERIKELEAQGVEVAYAVFDYMQLMDIYAKMSESERNTAVLGKIKQFCLTYNLVGFVVSQVTKAGGTAARTGASVLEAEAGQFLRSDKFNLVLTLNPIYAGGLLTNQAIINVAKNSLGSTGQECLYINPARLQWTDEIIEEADRIKENLGEIAF